MFVYADFRTVVKEQAETAAKTAEFCGRWMHVFPIWSIRHNRVFRSRPLSKRLARSKEDELYEDSIEYRA